MSHIDGDANYRYPGLGEPKPQRSDDKVLILTIGNQCVPGHWADDGSCKAWAPLPKRDKEKEARLGYLAKTRA